VLQRGAAQKTAHTVIFSSDQSNELIFEKKIKQQRNTTRNIVPTVATPQVKTAKFLKSQPTVVSPSDLSHELTFEIFQPTAQHHTRYNAYRGNAGSENGNGAVSWECPFGYGHLSHPRCGCLEPEP